MFATCINKDDDDDSEWAAFFVASWDHGDAQEAKNFASYEILREMNIVEN